MTETYTGGCACGSVQIKLTGKPDSMGFCHCTSCRAWSGDPVHTYALWPTDKVVVSAGDEYLATFLKTPDSLSHRKYCTKCGGHVMISHPVLGACDVYPGVVAGLDFIPTMHLNYGEAVLSLDDSLPKYRDFPSDFSDFGGTGELMS